MMMVLILSKCTCKIQGHVSILNGKVKYGGRGASDLISQSKGETTNYRGKGCFLL